MIEATDFLDLCKKTRYTFYSGTPCSYLKPLINAAIDDRETDYYPAANEGDAVAMACGAYLAGRRAVVMFQNSGLGNAVNALTSLSYPFRFPFLTVVTHRGQPDGPADEPQHELMGAITENLLSSMRVKWEHLPDRREALAETFLRATTYMDRKKLPFVLIMRKGAIKPKELEKRQNEAPVGKRTIHFSETIDCPYSRRPTRTEALKAIRRHRQSSDIFIATTGKTGRELYSMEDNPRNFYMVGSMGSASSFALGAALCKPDRRFVVLDGDAAALMRMGNLASIGSFRPDNLLHIILDNEANDSTGGQETASPTVSFAAVAMACGYRFGCATDKLEELEQALCRSSAERGPCLIHFRIKKGSPSDLGRPRIKPYQVRERLVRILSRKP